MGLNFSSVVSFCLHDHSKVSLSPEVFLIAITTIVFVVYLKLNKNTNHKSTFINVSSLPGPKYTFSCIGNVLQMLPISRMLDAIVKWCNMYGPLIKINMGGNTYVILNSASSVEALYKSTHLGHIVKNPYIYKEVEVYAPNGLIISKGQRWKTSRKILAQSMSIQSLKNSIPKLNKHCLRLVEKMKILFQDGNPHSINTLCSLALFDIIGELITGLDLHNTIDGGRLHDAILEAEEMLSQKILRPWITFPLIWMFHPFSKREKELNAMKDECLENMISRRRRQEIAENSGDYTNEDIPTHQKSIIDLLLDSKMDDKQLAVEVLVMFVGGHDTSASAIHFFCFLMALHPEFQTKCREEIESVLGDRTELTWDDVNNLKYLEQCIRESLRLFPTVPITSRLLEEPLILGENQVLPVGTNVLVLPYTMHRNPEYYSDPEKYDPNRFTPEETAKRPNASYIPFLMGQRNCLGFKFAMVELKVVAAYLLRNFELSTKHTRNEIPVTPKFLLKAERDYVFSCKVLP